MIAPARSWLASCSLAPRTPQVRAALLQLDDDAAQPDAWLRFERAVGDLRAELAALIGATTDQVALAPSASVAAYQALSCLRGPHAGSTLTSHAEFPSVAHVWERYRQVHGGSVRYADARGTRTVDSGPAYLAALVAAPPDLVSVPMVAYDTGERLPVEQVVASARAVGARTVVDAYQYVGTGPVDVRELGCDVLIGGTSKYLLGLPGLAFCYVRDPGALPHMPRLTGWWGRHDPLAFDHHRIDFPGAARLLETGTPPVPAVYAALAGLRALAATPADEVRTRRDRLTTAAWDVLEDLGRPPVTPRDAARRGAHLAVPSPDATGEAAALAARGVVCAPRGGLLRFAFHTTNDLHDLDRLAGALVPARSRGSVVDKGELTR